jgi:cell division protein FtsB
MSSIREQLRLKGLYAEFDALKAEVSDLKARVSELENPPRVEITYSNPVIVPKRRGRPPKVRDDN